MSLTTFLREVWEEGAMDLQKRLSEIEERLERATPGKWRYDVGNGEIEAGDSRIQVCKRADHEWPGHAPNMEMIESASEDVRFLLALVNDYRAALEREKRERARVGENNGNNWAEAVRRGQKIERLTAENAELRGALEKWIDEYGDLHEIARQALNRANAIAEGKE